MIIAYQIKQGARFRLMAVGDRKSTRLNQSHLNLVCRLLLEKKKMKAWPDTFATSNFTITRLLTTSSSMSNELQFLVLQHYSASPSYSCGFLENHRTPRSATH